MKEMKSLVIALLVAICNGQSTSKGGTRNELSSGIQTIQKELLLLRTELIKSKERISDLEEHMRERDEEIVNSPEGLSDLEEEARQRDAKIASLQEEMIDLEEDARQRDGEIDTLQHKISDLEDHVKQRDEEVDRIFASKGNSVFLARSVNSSIIPVSYNKGDKIKYNGIVTNPGGHYNKNTGEYTCPQTGWYFFSFSVYANNVRDGDNAIGHAALYKGNSIIGDSFVLSYNKLGIKMTVSQSFVVQCNKGEKISTRSQHQNVKIYSYVEANVFSGFLIGTP